MIKTKEEKYINFKFMQNKDLKENLQQDVLDC